MTNLLFGALVMLVLAATPARAITIGFDPATANVNVGSPVTVDLVIDDLGDGVAPSLSTFDLDVAFNDAVLSFLSATFGDPVLGDQLDLTGLGSVTAVTHGAGIVNVFELSLDLPSDLDNLQTGAFTLARLTFNAQAAGVSALVLSIGALGDANGNPLAADLGEGRIAVPGPGAEIPEPATLILLISGLAAASGTRKMKDRRC
jgi:hypothetical protein